jgi:FKBP-type peptidyl-prolyl cis-trans isomerase
MRRQWTKRAAALAAGLLAGWAILTAGISGAGASETTPASPAPALSTQKDKAGYGIGVELGQALVRQGIEADPDVVARGLKDAMTGSKLLLPDKELKEIMNTFAAERRMVQGRARLIAAQDNKKEGKAFLAENGKKEGVVTLPSGLQYKVIKAGEGRKATDADTVECHYRGTLLDGTEFDGTGRAAKAAALKVADKSLVPGLREALKLMPAGSRWQLFIPPDLAYGQRGAGRRVGPNATLLYDLELLKIR